MAWFAPDDAEGRVEHALKVERLLVNLGYLVAAIGVLGILVTLFEAVTGSISWYRAGMLALGVLTATVLSGAAAYGSGTNIGLSAMRLQEQIRPKG